MMRKASRILVTVIFAVVVGMTFAACAPQERMDAYVKLAHPDAWLINRVDNGLDNNTQAYILCEAGAVRVVITNHNVSADIMKDVKLDQNHVSCK